MLFQVLIAQDGGLTFVGFTPQSYDIPAAALVRRSQGLTATATAMHLAGVKMSEALVTVNATASFPF